MSSQKLKRVSLGIVGALILGVLLWFALHGRAVVNIHHISSRPYSEWDILLGGTLTAFVLILGLFLVAKILIEIFK